MMPPAFSKHAIIGLTRTGAIEFADKGIRVNAVMSTEAGRRRVLSMHPVGRIGEPQEVSDVVLWLCSREASFVTGAAVPGDGGFLLK